ncbi:ABC transporter ATP-binding protein [Alicyclobacillus acidiphilus]|uniref:ABC transporter ATP-binding protein n=1 Tax=Alicyclobacillus acidiphilus TaxID=182455 RepID=UPI0009FA9784|nr:polysaccharide ABC transporter ATP-binding protein [Alicyclobacillus acidiphilus]
MEPAITVDHVTKTYRVHTGKNTTLKDRVINAGRARYQEFVALSDVSFTVERGTTVALIGSNGSGKSTALKLISRILYPDKGEIHLNGRVSSLLELGAGFHPDFTGVENIFLNASLLGLSRKEIRNKLQSIIEFSEIGDFIHEPIRSYSSGMYMRLAFSIAIAVEPDILLLDEVLAVGDAAFQAKCFSKIQEMQKQGVTIVLVSHDSSMIEKLCDHVVWLHNSVVKMQGPPRECIPVYLETIFESSQAGGSVMKFDRVHQGRSDVSTSGSDVKIGYRKGPIKRANIVGDRGSEVMQGSRVSFDIVLCPERPIVQGLCQLQFCLSDGTVLWATSSKQAETGLIDIPSGEQMTLRLTIDALLLPINSYRVNLLLESALGEFYDRWDACLDFEVVPRQEGQALLELNHVWTVLGGEHK